MAAQENGVRDIKDWCDRMSGNFKALTNALNVQPTRFIRTTDADHVEAVRHIWKILLNKGDIYRGKHGGWYSVSDETFYPTHAILEVDGRKISKETGKTVEWVEEENFMFRLSNYRERILAWLQSKIIHPESRANDLWDYIHDPAHFVDISVSRKTLSAKWGINVPDDSTQVIYVWLDALTNYLTVSGYPENNVVPDVHVIGKDILK